MCLLFVCVRDGGDDGLECVHQVYLDCGLCVPTFADVRLWQMLRQEYERRRNAHVRSIICALHDKLHTRVLMHTYD